MTVCSEGLLLLVLSACAGLSVGVSWYGKGMWRIYVLGGALLVFSAPQHSCRGAGSWACADLNIVAS